MATPAPTPQYDVAGPIWDGFWAGIAATPGVWWNAFLANPGPWLLIAAMMAGLVTLRIVADRFSARRRRVGRR